MRKDITVAAEPREGRGKNEARRLRARGAAPAVIYGSNGNGDADGAVAVAIDPKDVNIQVHGDTLSVTGERKVTNESKEANYYHREISYGSFERAIALPEGVETDKINAEYRNGVLEITAPISAAALPRRIEIKSAQPESKQVASAGR